MEQPEPDDIDYRSLNELPRGEFTDDLNEDFARLLRRFTDKLISLSLPDKSILSVHLPNFGTYSDGRLWYNHEINNTRSVGDITFIQPDNTSRNFTAKSHDKISNSWINEETGKLYSGQWVLQQIRHSWPLIDDFDPKTLDRLIEDQDSIVTIEQIFNTLNGYRLRNNTPSEMVSTWEYKNVEYSTLTEDGSFVKIELITSGIDMNNSSVWLTFDKIYENGVLRVKLSVDELDDVFIHNCMVGENGQEQPITPSDYNALYGAIDDILADFLASRSTKTI